jgi:hypothetical protein
LWVSRVQIYETLGPSNTVGPPIPNKSAWEVGLSSVLGPSRLGSCRGTKPEGKDTVRDAHVCAHLHPARPPRRPAMIPHVAVADSPDLKPKNHPGRRTGLRDAGCIQNRTEILEKGTFASPRRDQVRPAVSNDSTFHSNFHSFRASLKRPHPTMVSARQDAKRLLHKNMQTIQQRRKLHR